MRLMWALVLAAVVRSESSTPSSSETCAGEDSLPKVSVVITTYNRWDGLVLAVESVTSQSYPNLEVVVVDDASTHGEYKDQRKIQSLNASGNVVWVRQPQNSRVTLGYPAVAVTRNTGIQKVCGITRCSLEAVTRNTVAITGMH
jgi:glycosyltransferase involved in cell wall biosynthesis